MNEKVRLVDIARKAKVSLGTVDRVVNGRGNVAPKTEARIREILKEFNYEPNLMASSLASRKKLRLAVLLPRPYADDYWKKIMHGIELSEKEISAYGCSVSVFLYEQYDDIQYTSYAEEIMKKDYDGLLTAPVFQKESRVFAAKLDSHAIPYIYIDAEMSGTNPLCSVSQDVFQSGRLGARLLDYGLREKDEILMVSIWFHSENTEHSLVRADGFKDYFGAKGKSGRTIHQLEIVNPKYEMLSEALDKILTENKSIKGIFINNSKAHLIARYLEEHSHPEMKLVGFDLIRQNVEALRTGIIDFLIYDRSERQGAIALNILFDHLSKRKASPAGIKMPVHIATRENLDGILSEQD